MLSLIKVVQSRRERNRNAGASELAPESVDEVGEKSPREFKDAAADSDSESILKDPATAHDPDLNPGGLSFEEGASRTSSASVRQLSDIAV